jgi:hypothetical protein
VTAESQGFWLPKAGNSDADYEDAFAITQSSVAIADGATESSFARVWAEALVEGFTNEHAVEAELEPTLEDSGGRWWTTRDLREYVAPLQRAWKAKVPWDRLAWFAEDKARSGAFATLLVFQFLRDSPRVGEEQELKCHGAEPGLRWQALAIGDSCLFQIRDDTIRVAFPLVLAEQFNSRPILLSSNAANNDRVWETVTICYGDCRAGDTFLFATDALACWIMTEAEAGDKPWHALCGLESQAEFSALVTRLREHHSIRNDDVTLVRISAPIVISPDVDVALPEAGI